MAEAAPQQEGPVTVLNELVARGNEPKFEKKTCKAISNRQLKQAKVTFQGESNLSKVVLAAEGKEAKAAAAQRPGSWK